MISRVMLTIFLLAHFTKASGFTNVSVEVTFGCIFISLLFSICIFHTIYQRCIKSISTGIQPAYPIDIEDHVDPVHSQKLHVRRATRTTDIDLCFSPVGVAETPKNSDLIRQIQKELELEKLEMVKYFTQASSKSVSSLPILEHPICVEEVSDFSVFSDEASDVENLARSNSIYSGSVSSGNENGLCFAEHSRSNSPYSPEGSLNQSSQSEDENMHVKVQVAFPSPVEIPEKLEHLREKEFLDSHTELPSYQSL